MGAFLLLENKFSECETGAFHILLAGNTAGKEFMIMNKVIITSAVISKGYESKPALRYNEARDCVHFKIGYTVYDKRAENNTRWINIKDDRFFILSLFAIVKELTKDGTQPMIEQITLAVGLPPEHYGAGKEGFANYFKRDGAVDAHCCAVLDGTRFETPTLQVLFRQEQQEHQSYLQASPRS